MIKVENCTLIIAHFKIIPKYCTNWVLSNCRVFKLCYVFCTYVISRWLAIHLIYIEKEKKLLFFSRQLMPKSIKNNRKDGPCVKQMETILHQPNVTRQVHHGKSFIRTHVQKNAEGYKLSNHVFKKNANPWIAKKKKYFK